MHPNTLFWQTHFRVSKLYNLWSWNIPWLGWWYWYAEKDIVFCWIPSHTGIKGTEKADFAAMSALDLPCTKVGVPYTDFKNLISQYIFSTWQDDWNGAVMNKLHSAKPVLGEWQSSYRRCRKDEVVLCRARIGHTHLTHLEERSSTSVWALSVYSDSSPHCGGVQSFWSRKERYIW